MEKLLFPACVVMRREPIVNRWMLKKRELGGVEPAVDCRARLDTVVAGCERQIRTAPDAQPRAELSCNVADQHGTA